ncbi:olfactory receptor 2T34-like protein [Leptotrombidium deliense]|uniref:Olfactory receptor 2T34-like protein n=1 Tax=Leptotrombidium deliense TaxID=299467 RepID=A0A443SKH0_9ACAR|nr:olfactory receptor 2T34-like protein [Leptotrombidium deliense]
MLVHLASINIAFCALILTNTSFYFVQHAFTKSSAIFETQGYFWAVLPLILTWTVCGLTCDRYLAVCAPLHYSRTVTRKRVNVSLIALWICSLSLCSLPFFGICSYTYSDPRFTSSLHCETCDDKNFIVQTSFVVIYVTITVIAPITFIFACNLQTLLIARHHRHRITSAIYEVTLRVQATVTHQRNNQYLTKAKHRNDLFTVSQLIIIAFNVPFHLIFAVESLSNQTVNSTVVSIVTVLLTFTPSMNGYVYGVKSKLLKETFKRLLQRYLYKKQATLEIDRRLSLRSQPSSKTISNVKYLLSMSALNCNDTSQTTRRSSAPNILAWPSSPICDSKELLRFNLVRRQSLIVQDDRIQQQLSPLFVATDNNAKLAETRLTTINEN